MKDLPMGITLRRAHVPARFDDPSISDIERIVGLRNDDLRAVHGTDEYDATVAQWHAIWRSRRHPVVGRLAVQGREIVASGATDFPQDAGSRAAGISIRVRSDRRGCGIGGALLRELEPLARDRGRVFAQAWTEHAPRAGVVVTARTGHGSVPLDASSRFAGRHLYALEQVFRNSVLDVASRLPQIESLLADARARTRTRYDYESWEIPTPVDQREGVIRMKARMSTDAPSAGLQVADEEWDAARLARLERVERTGGWRKVVGVARDRDSGEIVAITELSVDPSRPSFALQNDTLVLAEHRGRRLGMLVKCETLLRMCAMFPTVERIKTYNAEENRPMLAINEEMGFSPVLYAGQWQKTLR